MTNSPTLEACLRIGSLPVSRARALSNYVMALAAHGHTCKHVVELSETPFCHYTYSNLTKVVTNLQFTVSEFQQFISPYLNDLKHDREGGQKIYQLAYDFTKQIKGIFSQPGLPFSDALCCLSMDAGFGKAKILSPLYEQEQLVCICRLRAGRKVWTPYSGAAKASGAKRIFDEVYYLRQETRTIKTLNKQGQAVEKV